MGPNTSISGRGNSVNKNTSFTAQQCGYTIFDSISTLLKLSLLFLASFFAPAAFSQTTSYDITNIAHVSQDTIFGKRKTTASNAVTVKVITRTPSEIELLQYAPQLSEAELLTVRATGFDNTGNGDFLTLKSPKMFGTLINLDDLVPLHGTNTFHMGEPVFIRLMDLDQNNDPEKVETILVTITTNSPLDVEILELQETGTDTGIFTGFIQTSTTRIRLFDGILTVSENIEITTTYTDDLDRFDISTAKAIVDPFGIVFNSLTGELVDGVGITIIDANTDSQANVFGDDGFSTFPSTIVTGDRVEDSSGFVYIFPAGAYRFPFLQPGDYRLEITPPVGLRAPSVMETEKLQTLPNGPFTIVPGSRGEPFTINPGPGLRIDVPLDPTTADIFVRKSSSKATVGIGEFVQYRVEVENPDTEQVAIGVTVFDNLPLGFRYRIGSARLNGETTADPEIALDGGTLNFDLGNLAAGVIANLSYVVEVGPGTRFGEAVNTAQARTFTNVLSNVAEASVEVVDDLLQDKTIIVGKVTAESYHDNANEEEGEEKSEEKSDSAKDGKKEQKGVPGIRIYMENGSSVVTDQNGMYHFDNVTPGVHVVQLDLESLPSKYEPVDGWNDRFARRGYSQFVDLQGGSLWRADFSIRVKPVPKGHVNVQLTSERKNGGYTQAYNIKLEGTGVAVNNLRVMAMLPNTVTYVKKSCTVNEEAATPENNNTFLTWRLENKEADWQKTVCFKAEVKEAKIDDILKVMVMFDTPTAKNQRMPIVEILASSPYAYSGVESTETTGKLELGEIDPNEGEKDGPADPTEGFDAVWLESTEAGAEWIYPSEDYLPPIGSVKVGIKHDPQHKVTLMVGDVEVSPLNFDRKDRNSAKTVAVSHWRGIDLVEGDNHFVAIIKDKEGNETARIEQTVHYSSPPVKAEFIPELSTLIADGKTKPQIAVRLTDITGHAARHGIIGEYDVDAPLRGRRTL